jgi:hypothetical protein
MNDILKPILDLTQPAIKIEKFTPVILVNSDHASFQFNLKINFTKLIILCVTNLIIII